MGEMEEKKWTSDPQSNFERGTATRKMEYELLEGGARPQSSTDIINRGMPRVDRIIQPIHPGSTAKT